MPLQIFEGKASGVCGRRRGRLRCSPPTVSMCGVLLSRAASHPPLWCRLRIHDGKSNGAYFYNTRPRLERCELWGNAGMGVYVEGGGDLTLDGCTIRDHARIGLYVEADSHATVGAECVFARNAGGDVMRRG